MFCDELMAEEAIAPARARSDRGVSDDQATNTAVVPAKAGTHSHHCQLLEMATNSITLRLSRGVWVPAFAGTTTGVAPHSAGTMLGAKMASRCSGRSRLAWVRNSSAMPRSDRLSSPAVASVSSLVRSRTIA